MALIKCGECRREVSDRAVSCPQCGAPVAARAVVTTQVTAKTFKRDLIVGTAILCVGLVVLVAGFREHTTPLVVVGALLAALGGICILVARFRAWWHHG